MPVIKFDHIISCSTQDRNHPATNLLKQETYRKWRSEKAGEEKATVIIQLERETEISSIDIGNNGSATVEILVGKSSAPDDEYKVLLQTSTFMSPSESKNSENLNRVRMFQQEKLCPDIAEKKWDRIMIKCTQPWGYHQYGLSFITLHSLPDDTVLPENPPTTTAVEDEFKPGSLFARWKASKTDGESSPVSEKPRTAAAKIAESSTLESLEAMENVKTKAANIVPKKRSFPSESTPPAKKQHTVVKDNRKTLERDNTPPPELAEAKKAVESTSTITRKHKPFNELMSGVRFVLSGFQNPLRSELRQKALDMGAFYQQDWTPTSTHLICAFANTPKVKQVRGKGKLVKQKWIEHCHRDRKYYPWRRYALDQSDEDADESEEEIWEEPEIVLDDDDDLQEIPVESTSNAEVVDLVDTPPKAKKRNIIESDSDEDYNAETDNESDSEIIKTLPKLPDVFAGKKFAMHFDISDQLKEKLNRYIIALGGIILDDLDLQLDYLITETNEGVEVMEEFFPKTIPVIPTWIYRCNDAKKIIPLEGYRLVASPKED